MATYIVVDVEADGPIPGKYSMVCFGAVIVEPGLNRTFYAQTSPISGEYITDALKVSGFSREEHLLFPEPKKAMEDFEKWIKENTKGHVVFISDNPAFDWQWINYYFHSYLERNPFGYSARRIGDLYCGMKNNMGLNSEWKKLFRKTKHDHNPVNDAKGNAEALLAMEKLGLKL